jgi:hypothetical protein
MKHLKKALRGFKSVFFTSVVVPTAVVSRILFSLSTNPKCFQHLTVSQLI